MNVQRPIFIVGAPRSGTTLLQVMISQIPGVYVCPETKFLANTMLRRRQLGSLNDDRGFENTLLVIQQKVCRQNELPVDWDVLESELRACTREYAYLFDTLLCHIQIRQDSCRRVGEKSPNHIRFVPYLLEFFRDAQVINIIRDGRDAYVSQREAFGREIVDSAFRWRQYVRLHARLSDQVAEDQYTSVKYENLVAHPERELKRLCEFLQEEYDSSMLLHHKRTDKGFAERETHKQRTLEPLTDSRVGRYRHALSPTEIAIYQSIAGRWLNRFGYPLESVSTIAGYVGAAARIPFTLIRKLRYRWSQKLDVIQLP